MSFFHPPKFVMNFLKGVVSILWLVGVVLNNVLFVGKLQGRVPSRVASQFLRQQQKQATPWLFHETVCSVKRCTESKSM